MQKKAQNGKDKTTIIVVCIIAVLFVIACIIGATQTTEYPEEINLGNGVIISKYRIGSSTICDTDENCIVDDYGWIEIRAVITNNSGRDLKEGEVTAYFDVYKHNNIFSDKEYIDTCKITNRRPIEDGGSSGAVETQGCAILLNPNESISGYTLTNK